MFLRTGFLLSVLSVLLAGCSYGWTRTNPGGEPYAHAEGICRAASHDSAVRQVSLDERNSDRYAAGSANMQLRDIEEQETALCLERRGFRLTPE